MVFYKTPLCFFSCKIKFYHIHKDVHKYQNMHFYTNLSFLSYQKAKTNLYKRESL